MPKTVIDCPECGTKSTITSTSTEAVQCCPFCGNTTLPVPNADDEDDAYDDDSLTEFNPDDDPED